MLDLITMTMAAGVQEELNTVRKETGVESPLTTEAVEPSVSPASQASADLIETCTDAVESVTSTLFDALPSFNMFNGLEIEMGPSCSTPAVKAN